MKKNLNLKSLIIAHRGIHNNQDIPENSLLAFKQALKEKMAIELDVQLTKDDELVVFHDNRLTRMTSSKQFLQDSTYIELQRLRLLETEEKIPTLQEALRLINGNVLLDIEIKSTDRVEDTCQILSEELKKYKGDFVVKSFNPSIVRWFNENQPDILRGLLITDDYHNKLFNHLVLSNLLFRYCEPNFLALSKKLSSKKKVEGLRKKYPLFLWTIESEEELNQYQEFGDSFVCNHLPYSKKRLK